jgi:hypothetical protein
MSEDGKEVRAVATATKVDYAKQLSHLYRAHDEPELVEVPALQYLMVDGHGEPGGSRAFRDAVDALLTVAGGLKSRIRKLDAIDYEVMPLEGLWWIPNARVWDFGDKSDWDWTLMVMQPELVSARLVTEVVEDVRSRRKRIPALDALRFDVFQEGRAAQVLHRGSWSKERVALERLYGFIRDHGLLPVGKHHEIYLTNPGVVSPPRMRTIVRQPVAELLHS